LSVLVRAAVSAGSVPRRPLRICFCQFYLHVSLNETEMEKIATVGATTDGQMLVILYFVPMLCYNNKTDNNRRHAY